MQMHIFDIIFDIEYGMNVQGFSCAYFIAHIVLTCDMTLVTLTLCASYLYTYIMKFRLLL